MPKTPHDGNAFDEFMSIVQKTSQLSIASPRPRSASPALNSSTDDLSIVTTKQLRGKRLKISTHLDRFIHHEGSPVVPSPISRTYNPVVLNSPFCK